MGKDRNQTKRLGSIGRAEALYDPRGGQPCKPVAQRFRQHQIAILRVQSIIFGDHIMVPRFLVGGFDPPMAAVGAIDAQDALCGHTQTADQTRFGGAVFQRCEPCQEQVANA